MILGRRPRFTFIFLAILLAAAMALAACSEPTVDAEGTAVEAEPEDVLGEVHFPVSCDETVQDDFDRAVATLHSFEFQEARGMFEAIADEDPSCAMAHWGVAMTHYHPLWAPPSESEIEAGQAAVANAQRLEKTDRESMYVDAIATFYRDAASVDHRERATRYEKAMAEVHEAYPEDPEAKIFYALAVLSNADPTDKTYAVQKRVGGMLEPMFAKMPNHPGLAHYIIHAYDYPPLAERAEEAAHRYLEIATSMPHALHMSGHIFTQLGMWDHSIEANSRSAAAARERAQLPGAGGQAQLNEMHALDYQLYAHLQRGEDEKARRIVDDVTSRADLNWGNWVVAFNAGAIPVRWALERKAWEEAASLPPLEKPDAVDPGYTITASVALRHWARAVGAARSGRIELAEQALGEVEQLAEELAGAPGVWARNTGEVLRLEAAAWIAQAKGNGEKALELLRAAAKLEDQTDKSGLSPGRVLPVHEQLGDLLLKLDRPAEALAEYEESLEHAPRRFNSYLGAARAAEAAGKPEVAREYYQKLLEVAAPESARAELDEAREYLS